MGMRQLRGSSAISSSSISQTRSRLAFPEMGRSTRRDGKRDSYRARRIGISPSPSPHFSSPWLPSRCTLLPGRLGPGCGWHGSDTAERAVAWFG